MQYELRYEEHKGRATAWIESRLDGPEIDHSLSRLKAWALIRGAGIAGSPFLVMRSPLITEVHLPIDGDIRPHPETGVGFAAAGGGPVIEAGPVHLLDIRALDREVRGEFDSRCHFAGPPEFHGWQTRGPLLGWLHFRVSELPLVRPAMLAVPDAVMAPALASPSRQVAAAG